MHGKASIRQKIKTWNWKEIGKDLLIDVAAGLLIGAGLYNFAAEARFPLTGVSGIALILYQLLGTPIGTVTVFLNIPIAVVCFRTLGKQFFLRSIRSLIITSLMIDWAAPLFPVYTGDRFLASICCGLLSGLGYAMVFMNRSSTGGMDFISMAVHKRRPHLSLGKIIFVADIVIVLLGGLVYREIDGIIYGFLVTYLQSVLIDRLMSGLGAGKMTLIVTGQGKLLAGEIDRTIGRGSTILKGKGSYSGAEREILLCACSTKQMYVLRKMVRERDEKAFMVIMEANEVVGEGFLKE